jgi:hypothetical protein
LSLLVNHGAGLEYEPLAENSIKRNSMAAGICKGNNSSKRACSKMLKLKKE